MAEGYILLKDVARFCFVTQYLFNGFLIGYILVKMMILMGMRDKEKQK